MRKYMTHQNLDLNTQDPETTWKAIFSNLTCLLQKCKFHKFTFTSIVCFIKLSEDINILSFAKTQSLALSFIGQKILMCGIVSLNFFSYWSWENFNSKVGKSSLLVLSYKKLFTIFNATRLQQKKNAPECIYVMCCMIWDQTLKNGVQMVGQTPF